MPTVSEENQKTCFVVMGFGEKTDFQTQRKLDLDKTYRLIIKRAVENAGLNCVRADDVIHAGIIDKPMYELLLSADVVVADLSTSNANAIYELGVRHALRPNTTIVIAESQFKFPFDLGHLLIRPYQHLGAGIDGEEAERMRDELTKTIKALLSSQDADSPVYTFLPTLGPPSLRAEAAVVAKAVIEEAMPAKDVASTALLDGARRAIASDDFITARALLTTLRERQPNDAFVVQQLALATYKSKLPTPEQALLEAHKILHALDPKGSSDPETLGLWGAIHKRLWEANGARADLDEAVWAYARGFYLRNDSYTGINYAFLLNVRASLSERAEAIADYVTAMRVRRRVIEACEQVLKDGVKDETGKEDSAATFWVLATLVEAYVGTGDEDRGKEVLERAKAIATATWMLGTLQDQLGKLRPLLQAQSALVRF